MGMEVKIRLVGRKGGGEKWLDAAYSTYETRLRSSNLSVSTQYHKNDIELSKGEHRLLLQCDIECRSASGLILHTYTGTEADESKNHKVVLLDPLGKMFTSEAFSENVYHWLEEGGSRLTFVIGGAEGLPEDLKRGRAKISLGMMTFTHQFARVMLIEQIYRASEIRKGSGYHK